MAASSSSPPGAGRNSKGPQVFLNFRGEELRKTFVDNLEAALRQANINVFIDEHLVLGTKLQDLLVKIEQSKVALAIFSKDYTTSKWCLDELVKIKECMDKDTLVAVPIFYKIETSVVSHLEEKFGDNFRKLKRDNQHDLLRTAKWEEALTSIPEAKGMRLSEQSDKTDRQFTESVVENVKILLVQMERKANEKRERNNSQYSMIYAKKLEIAHSDKPENWTWSSTTEEPNDIATLNEVYWMKIGGNFYTRKLTLETKYEVVFVVQLEDTATGWHVPVTLNLTLIMRDNSEIPQKPQILRLDNYIGDDGWVYIKAGDFVTRKDAPVRISFTMDQHDDAVKKTGLVVKGVAIRAVN